MIVTLTPNPSLDRTLEVPSLINGDVIRASSTRIDAGGKGINVSRALRGFGIASEAIFPVGGLEGNQIIRLLEDELVVVRSVSIASSIRMNISIVEPGGLVTKINEPGPCLSDDEEAALITMTKIHGGGARWVVGSGTLPKGMRKDFYSRLMNELSDCGCKVAIDTSGDALNTVIPYGPTIVKPNREELEGFCGQEIVTLGDAIDAAKSLLAAGAKSALVSLGSHGAFYINERQLIYGEVRPSAIRSSVGAGDCLLAGFLSAYEPGQQALAEALAWAGASVSLPGSVMPNRAVVDRSSVVMHNEIDRTKLIKEGSSK
ncbi:1-phosphofructokinase family hexose kinase [Acidithrix sp. C25]|uniref:1-phosphofructokinase family hexose kinase n=1 Tax=Acidithrix sp. C25 TaxID=1671482 RepID=UPI00191BA516|nr:1-phosphofructokinase family hexose kinase [Acidithrix sp. C25]CAG4908379.1 unnamed protein product [Acidithrix sp. C25]